MKERKKTIKQYKQYMITLILIFMFISLLLYNKEISNQNVVLSKKNEVLLEVSQNQHSLLNYLHHPDKFVEIISDCITDDYCHLHYLHIPKTGGRTIENKLNRLFPGNGRVTAYGVLKRFKRNSKPFCMKAFYAYEIYGELFYNDVIPTCLEHYKDTKHRLITLGSTREPVSRSLSLFHQHCNQDIKFYKGEVKKHYLALCKKCNNYTEEEDLEKWKKELNDTVYHYQSLYDHFVMRDHDPNVPALLIDTADITPFFHQLKVSLPDLYADRLDLRKKKYNVLHEGECKFYIGPELVKNLTSTFDIYRKMSSMG